MVKWSNEAGIQSHECHICGLYSSTIHVNAAVSVSNTPMIVSSMSAYVCSCVSYLCSCWTSKWFLHPGVWFISLWEGRASGATVLLWARGRAREFTKRPKRLNIRKQFRCVEKNKQVFSCVVWEYVTGSWTQSELSDGKGNLLRKWQSCPFRLLYQSVHVII